ncbi:MULTISPECIES: DNA cytosine methyltransferase [Streptomyces]|uniref:DNA cytosine methyltransferase n=1 Tax=Streptomyces TaxID=1883 RepID=UPI0004AAE9D6|nr:MULTISPECIES: DNA cytosine methyltransferase [Streptomyces]
MSALEVVEICAGAGGQALGLEQAGFEHRLAVELDPNACDTLRLNRPTWKVAEGDVADESVWNPEEYEGVSLLAGGVPCPPFTIAGKQLGATDERDLFAWAVQLAGRIKPKALMLENVRGLSANRFSAYRQHVLDTLRDFGYVGEWRLLQASQFGVPQLRPRFVLVALQDEYAEYFHWPEPLPGPAPTVGETLKDLMAAKGWGGAEAWAAKASDIAPTIVGGSKKHGGADLGPSRAKAAWEAMGVDAWGLANDAPDADFKPAVSRKGEVRGGPKLTSRMAARIQGFSDEWQFSGGKTTGYRQIGNAFPPPVAKAVGLSIAKALRKEGAPRERVETTHDPVYRLLRGKSEPMTAEQIVAALGRTGVVMGMHDIERRLSHLGRDFHIEETEAGQDGAMAYLLRDFKAFVGQEDHDRHELFKANKAKIS